MGWIWDFLFLELGMGQGPYKDGVTGEVWDGFGVSSSARPCRDVTLGDRGGPGRFGDAWSPSQRVFPSSGIPWRGSARAGLLCQLLWAGTIPALLPAAHPQP